MNQNTIPMSICNTNKKIHILICVSGSVAAMKIPELVVKLYNHAYIRIVCTKSALFFIKNASNYEPVVWNEFNYLYGNMIRKCNTNNTNTTNNTTTNSNKDRNKENGLDMFIIDDDEWDCWSTIGDPVLHIELVKWAHICLVVPASSDILSKMSIG